MPTRAVTLSYGEAAIAPRHELGPITQDSPADMPRGFIPQATADRVETAIRHTILGARLRGIGMRGRVDTGPQESVRQSGLKKASVKPVHEFFEIELAPGAAAPVIGPIDECFRQTDDRVHPMKDLGSLRITTEINWTHADQDRSTNSGGVGYQRPLRRIKRPIKRPYHSERPDDQNSQRNDMARPYLNADPSDVLG